MTPLDRTTLITLARELRGMAGVSVVRKHLRQATHDLLRAEVEKMPLVLRPEWRVE